MDVAIRVPFRLEFDIVSVEHRYPSVEFCVVVPDARQSHEIFFRETIWIERSVWDKFMAQLSSTEFITAGKDPIHLTLSDMSDEFRFEINNDGKSVILVVSFEKKHNSEQSQFKLLRVIDDDIYGHIRVSFVKCFI